MKAGNIQHSTFNTQGRSGLKIYLLWFALCGLLAWFAPAQLPPMPSEQADDVYWPDVLFSVQSPKGNQLDPLATIPITTKTVVSFASIPGRLELRIAALDIPSVPVVDPRYSEPTKAVDVVLGTPGHKLVWTGNSFTAGQPTNGVTIHCERVILLSWNQETNQVSEVYWSTDLKNWFSLQNVQYTGQWAFQAADCLTYPRFYRLLVQTP